jgi:arginine/ornithine N-succinyltransferase beta subunit
MEALEQLMMQMVEKQISVPQGVSLRKTLDDETEEEVWEMSIDNTFIISYRTVDDSYSYVVNENYNTINDLVCKTPVLVELLQSIARDIDY